MKNLYFLFLTIILVFISTNIFSQGGTCATAINLGTPSTSSSCQTFTTSSGTSSNTSCVGAGWGGNSFDIRYVTFCTNASNSCINFDFNSTGGWGGNINFTLYQGSFTCATSIAMGAVQQCNGGLVAGGSVSFAPTDNGGNLVTTANTCYTLRIAFENAPTAANPIQMCVYTQAPAVNNVCTGALPISGVPQTTNNDPACAYSAGPITNTPSALTPGSFCAGSLENTAWYTFTVSATGSVVITINGIVCIGGGSGFQIGFFTGSCGSLTNLGCTSGSGGSVTATITGLTAGQVVTIGIDGNAGAFCTFGISATNTVALPITLSHFDAKYNPKTSAVELDWTTSSEINNDFFTIERSLDAENFEVVAIVKGAGNSNNLRTYDTLDTKPYTGTSFYRLKQTDFDGQFEYSDVRAVKVEQKIEDITLYPNPVSGNGTLAFNAVMVGTTTIVIYDVSGRIVYSQTYSTNKGNNTVLLTTNSLSNGMYFMGLSNGNTKENLKFIKE